ncbi:hypothetical protein WN943_023678 [Citrus x changshan-huyou]
MVHDLLMVFGTDCVSSTFRWKKIYFCKHPSEVYTLQKIAAQCLLHLEEESGESKELECDFDKQKHRGYKHCCGDCGFQVGVGCASKLIKYHHQGQQHVEHFSRRY